MHIHAMFGPIRPGWIASRFLTDGGSYKILRTKELIRWRLQKSVIR